MCDGGVYPLIRITQEFPADTAWWGGNGNLAGGEGLSTGPSPDDP